MITLVESIQEFGAAVLLGSAGLGVAYLRKLIRK